MHILLIHPSDDPQPCDTLSHLLSDVSVPVTCQLALLGPVSLLGLKTTLSLSLTATLLADLKTGVHQDKMNHLREAGIHRLIGIVQGR